MLDSLILWTGYFLIVAMMMSLDYRGFRFSVPVFTFVQCAELVLLAQYLASFQAHRPYAVHDAYWTMVETSMALDIVAFCECRKSRLQAVAVMLAIQWGLEALAIGRVDTVYQIQYRTVEHLYTIASLFVYATTIGSVIQSRREVRWAG